MWIRFYCVHYNHPFYIFEKEGNKFASLVTTASTHLFALWITPSENKLLKFRSAEWKLVNHLFALTNWIDIQGTIAEIMVATNYSCEKKKPMVSIGHKICAALWCAQVEERLIIGLNEAVRMLSKSPNNSLFCILAPAPAGNTSTHIQEVLLEAYCYENDIYIMKVNTAERLTRILGTRRPQSCVLIQKSPTNAADITAIEGELIDYCEEIWNEPNATPISLPWTIYNIIYRGF